MAGKGSRRRPCNEDDVAKNWVWKKSCPECNTTDCLKAEYPGVACKNKVIEIRVPKEGSGEWLQ